MPQPACTPQRWQRRPRRPLWQFFPPVKHCLSRHDTALRVIDFGSPRKSAQTRGTADFGKRLATVVVGSAAAGETVRLPPVKQSAAVRMATAGRTQSSKIAGGRRVAAWRLSAESGDAREQHKNRQPGMSDHEILGLTRLPFGHVICAAATCGVTARIPRWRASPIAQKQGPPARWRSCPLAGAVPSRRPGCDRR